MSDFVRQPLNEKLNKKNYITRIRQLERLKTANPSGVVGELGNISERTGSLIVDELLVEDNETGTAAVTIDSNGIAILYGGANNVNKITWKSTDGSTLSSIYSSTTTTDAPAIVGTMLGKLTLNAGTYAGIELQGYDTTGSTPSAIVINSLGGDVDTFILGNSNSYLFQTDASAQTIVGLNLFGGAAVDKTAFTPTIIGTTAAGVGTYTTQLGSYTRIANMVFFKIALVWTAHTGTGNMEIAGLPVTSANDSIIAPLAVQWSNITLLAIGNKIMATVQNNATGITLQEIGSGAASALPIDGAATLRVAGFYFA